MGQPPLCTYQGAEPPLHLLWVRAAARLALLVEGHGEGLRWQLELLACGEGQLGLGVAVGFRLASARVR